MYWPAKISVLGRNTPLPSTGLSTSRPYFCPTAKSSWPWPGAVCTAPVPASTVT
jgi:hypothetical protein